MFQFFRRSNPPPAKPVWQLTDLFQGFTEPELDWLDRRVAERHLTEGEVLVHEGEEATHLYVLASGTVEVMKREKHGRRSHNIKRLTPGDVIGEIALLDQLPRAASVQASRACKLYGLDFAELKRLAEKEKDPLVVQVHSRLTANLAHLVARKLRIWSEDALVNAHERAAMGELIVNTLILLCGYVLLVAGLPNLPANSTFFTIPLLLVFGLGSWRFIRGSGYPLSEFGLSHQHLFGSLFESVVFTLPFLVVATGIKWVVLQTDDAYAGVKLIQNPDVVALGANVKVQALLLVYAVSSAVQELIVRGALQSMLERFLGGRGGQVRAIVVCALLFAVSHLHTSLLFAFLAFVPGIFWGWLFARKRNLLGVTLSHIVVGGYVFFVLGINLPK